MAKDLSDSINRLSEKITALSDIVSKKGIGERAFAKLGKNEEFGKKLGKLQAFVGNVDKLNQWASLTLRASDINRGLAQMKKHPGMWATPDEYLKYEKRHMLATREALSYSDPRAYKRQSLISAYGAAGAASILQAEQSASIRDAGQEILRQEAKGREQYKRDRLSRSAQRYHELRERYGGTNEADALASEMLARETELRKSKAIHQKTIENFRKLPWLKTLVDAGIIQKKELPKIAKTMMKMSKAPVVGHFVKHPMMIPLAAVGASVALMERADRANVSRVGWDVLKSIYGEPSERFEAASRLAGMQNLDTIYQSWAKLVERYGRKGAETIFGAQGAALVSNKDPTFRANRSKALGWNAQTAMAAMYFASDEMIRNAPEHAITQARKSYLEDVKTYGLSSGSGVGATLRSLMLSAGGAELGARGEWKNAGMVFPVWVPTEAARSAESLIEAERVDPTWSKGGGGNNTVSFNIGRVEIKADNTRELVSGLMELGADRSGIDVMEAFDRREIA